MEDLLLAWFRVSGRDLPWRRTADPYAILVSEVMLQQTQVERVVPRYERWLRRWPSAASLAAASPADVIVEWQGLGYNRRAVMLHRAARHVSEHGWPDDLTLLPGVGTLHGRRPAELRLPRGRAAARRERRARRTAYRALVHGQCGAGPDGPRRDRLPRAHPPMREVPARDAVPLAGHARRTAPSSVALRGLLPTATRGGVAARRVGAAGRARAGRRRGALSRPRRPRGRRRRSGLPPWLAPSAVPLSGRPRTLAGRPGSAGARRPGCPPSRPRCRRTGATRGGRPDRRRPPPVGRPCGPGCRDRD